MCRFLQLLFHSNCYSQLDTKKSRVALIEKENFFFLVLECEVFSNIDWGNPEIHPQGRISDQCLKIRIGYLIQGNELDILHLYILPILLSYRNGN